MRKRRPKKKRSSTLILRWGVIAAFAFAMLAVFGEQGLLKYHEMRKSEAQLEQMTSQVRTENEKLARQIERLKDKEYLEKVAREELGLLRSDEVIYFVGKP